MFILIDKAFCFIGKKEKIIDIYLHKLKYIRNFAPFCIHDRFSRLSNSFLKTKTIYNKNYKSTKHMNFNFTKTCCSALLLAVMSFGMEAQAQGISDLVSVKPTGEGWYQITRNMSASDIADQLASNKNFLEQIGDLFGNLTRNDYLYVAEEFAKEQTIFGVKTGQRTYGAKYKNGLTEQISTGDVNTYFYVKPVEGKEDVYTIRSYNGHYLHADGTFSVNPEELYLGPAFDLQFYSNYTSKGWWDPVPGLINTVLNGILGIGGINNTVKFFNDVNGVSIGSATTTFDTKTATDILNLFNVELPIGFKASYKATSWQQTVSEVTKTETDENGETITTTETVRGDYLDAKNVNALKMGWDALGSLNTGGDYTKMANALLQFALNNFCSDSYRFHKIDLNNVAAGGDGYLGSIIGALDRKQLIPYTVEIEGWDGTFTVNKPMDTRDGTGITGFIDKIIQGATGVTTVNQLTHTNASVIINSNATHKEFESAPLYNGATIFAVKGNSLFNKKEGSFVDAGTEHECSNVVITPYDYSNGLWGLGANGVQDFSKCISAACVDEENHIIHVYFTEPGKQWKVNCEEGKYVTRNAPFALELATLSGLGEVGGFFEGTSDNVEVTYPVAVNGQELLLQKIDGVIPAHTPVLMKNTHKQSYLPWDLDLKVTHHMYFKVVDSDDVAPSDNLLHGVCFAYDLDSDVNAYVLKTIDGKQKFYKLNQEDRKLAPWRAYLEWDGAAGSALRIAGFDEDLEGVGTVLADDENAPIYDLSGRRVNSSNGVTISAGKKYITK